MSSKALIVLGILEDLLPPVQADALLPRALSALQNSNRGLISLFAELAEADVTSACLPGDEDQEAVILAREPGIVSGIHLITEVFRCLDPGILVTLGSEDGQSVREGDTVAKIKGDSRLILMGERTALNFLCHLSGVATQVNRYVQQLEGTRARLLDTRKTIPGYRVWHKQAVLHGGGLNHRQGLYDMVLVKNNHIDSAGGVQEAIDLVRAKWGKKWPVEVEARNLDEAETAARMGVERILLDNMTLQDMTRAVRMIAGRAQTEASGNVHLSNIHDIALCGVDYISVGGALTLSAPRLDFSLGMQN